MFQTEPSYSQQPHRVSSGGTTKRRLGIFRYLDAAALLAVLALLGYVGWYIVKLNRGITMDADIRLQTVRLQVINGGGASGLAERFARQLDGATDNRLEIRVVDSDDMDVRRVAQSFVISRTENTDAARALAERLGLDPSQVIYEPLEDNIRQITATLVLGDDHDSLRAFERQQEK